MRTITAGLILALSLPVMLRAQTPTPQVPVGTKVVVRTIDAIDSKSAKVGQTFKASLEAPLLVDGQEIAPKGTDATLRIVEATSSGKLKGKAELTIALVGVNSGEKQIQVSSTSVVMESDGKGKKSAATIGIGTGIGAAAGGIFGGGRGAAIGAGAGAGAGTAVAMASGQRVQISSETVLSFTVQ